MKAKSVLAALGLVLFLFPGASAESAEPVLEGSSMMIPWSDFKDILEKLTAKPPDTEEPPPVDAVVSSAFYKADVGSEKVYVSVKADIVVLKAKGWAVLPVLDAGVPIMDASLDGKPVALVNSDDGSLRLMLNGAGPHTLSLRMELDLAADSGPEQFNLPVVRAQVQRLEIKLNHPDLAVSLSPGGGIESRTQGQTTLAVGSFPPSGGVQVSWARRAPKTEKEEARVSAVVSTLLTVGEGLGVYSSIIDYDIRHKPMNAFRISLPQDVVLADVSSEGLADWRVEKTDQGQRLTVLISYEAIGRHQIAVSYEKSIPAGAEAMFGTADLTVEDVVHEKGFIAVAVRTNVQVASENLQNLAPVDLSELPPDLKGNADQTVLLGFKYIKHPAVLDLKVTKHAEASVLACAVEKATYRIMFTEEGKELIEAEFRVANRSRQFLTLTLPEGTDLWSVFRGGEPVKAAEKDGKILLPIYKGGLEETFTLKILAYRKTGSFFAVGRKSVELPSLDVGISEVRLQVFLPERFRYTGFGGKLNPSRAAGPTAGGEGDGLSEPVSDTQPDGKDSGGKKRDLDQLWDYDKNIQYRKAQVQVERSTVNLTAGAQNPAYTGSMTRGALPVQVDIRWQGVPYAFDGRIIDPGEAPDVSFFFARRFQAGWTLLLVWLCAMYLGYVGFVLFLHKKKVWSSDLSRTRKGYILLSAAAVILVSVFTGQGKSTLALAFLMGVICGILRWLYFRREKAGLKTPWTAPASPATGAPDSGPDKEGGAI